MKIEQISINHYQLENRIQDFAVKIRKTAWLINRNVLIRCDLIQVIRSSGSIGANYIEACESLSYKDKIHRLKISRKEARETLYWLQIISEINLEKNYLNMIVEYIREAEEIIKILSSIINKLSNQKELTK